jgi:hypothetical protein
VAGRSGPASQSTCREAGSPRETLIALTHVGVGQVRVAQRLVANLRWRSCEFEVSPREVVALCEERFASNLGRGVGQAVAKIERRLMT